MRDSSYGPDRKPDTILDTISKAIRFIFGHNVRRTEMLFVVNFQAIWSSRKSFPSFWEKLPRLLR